MTLGIELCNFCDRNTNGFKRIEHQFLEKFNLWGYTPSSHDTVIRNDLCETIKQHNNDKKNLYRADFVWITDNNYPYHVLAECDEHHHNGIDVSCEYKRLQSLCDQIISNTREVKPVIVIRFNPFYKNVEKLLKQSLEKSFKKGYETPSDARGFEVVEIIGYGKKRKREYENDLVTKKIKI